jgi:hypothetical protein
MNLQVARREFLATAGLSAVAAATRTLSAQPPAPKPAQGVRESVAGMAENHPTLVSFRKGVAAMRSLEADNPLSWDFQAGLHGFMPDGKEHAEWAWCQHGTDVLPTTKTSTTVDDMQQILSVTTTLPSVATTLTSGISSTHLDGKYRCSTTFCA